MDHQVVSPHEGSQFVLLVIDDILEMVHVGDLHLPTHFTERTEHTGDDLHRDDPGDHQQQEEDRNDGGDVDEASFSKS
jgi:hypothetical protein